MGQRHEAKSPGMTQASMYTCIDLQNSRSRIKLCYAVHLDKSAADGMKGSSSSGSWAELRAGGGRLFRQPFKREGRQTFEN